ncbi:unnamed protein product [Prorocentrum cordatum]|uniref:ATPase RavA-like AAA lid domain-containing protein n=1 Tax=Prorocentrum cordatum TaxID=2364126 RepID=A0ABN9UJI4_9DINO|nr:unnamed protein product [Polarella glacialis]
MYSGPPPGGDADLSGTQGRDVIKQCGELVPQVAFGSDTKAVLVELLRVLHEEHALGEGNSLLTDRTFLVKAVKVLKAHAVLNGRLRCEPHDLTAMRHLTTFRVPRKSTSRSRPSSPDRPGGGTQGRHAAAGGRARRGGRRCRAGAGAAARRAGGRRGDSSGGA